MFSQALRIRRHTSIRQLQFYKRFNHRLKSASTSTSSEEETTGPVHFKKNTSRTAFIRTWEPFHNLADAWALLRVVERKYGQVAEAHFLKDYEIKNRYQVYTYVVFRDQESLKRVPKAGQSFHIPAPVIEDKPGGLGLDDIRHLLDSTDRDETFQLPSAASPEIEGSKERLIGARIERASKNFYTLPKVDNSRRANIRLAKLFLKWGGFHKLEPIEGSRDITERDCFEKTDLEQVRMRAALQWCSQVTGLANPAVLRKPTARDEDETVSEPDAASASMDSVQSSPPSTLDIPISAESTHDSTQSPSLLTETPQPQLQTTPESSQPLPESTPAPTTPQPVQLTPEQVLAKEALKRQMSRAKQLMAKTKQPPATKAQKPDEETQEERMPDVLDEFPEEPPQQSKSVIANIWKLFGR